MTRLLTLFRRLRTHVQAQLLQTFSWELSASDGGEVAVSDPGWELGGRLADGLDADADRLRSGGIGTAEGGDCEGFVHAAIKPQFTQHRQLRFTAAVA